MLSFKMILVPFEAKQTYPEYAQPALAADAASRRQDRADFDSWNLLQCHHGLFLAARLKRQSVGPRGVVFSLAACLGGNKHAACPFPKAAPARMPTQADRRRIMPESPSGSYWFLPISTERQRSMPSSWWYIQLAAALSKA
jgi:hypothetical protein